MDHKITVLVNMPRWGTERARGIGRPLLGVEFTEPMLTPPDANSSPIVKISRYYASSEFVQFEYRVGSRRLFHHQPLRN
jgi:hypothetical protein